MLTEPGVTTVSQGRSMGMAVGYVRIAQLGHQVVPVPLRAHRASMDNSKIRRVNRLVRYVSPDDTKMNRAKTTVRSVQLDTFKTKHAKRIVHIAPSDNTKMS